MINTLDRLVNQLLAVIYIDKNDPSVVRIAFDKALQIFANYEIIIPPKTFEATFTKVVEERLVGKIQANDVAKWAIAQAMTNTAVSLAISKEELLRLKLRDNDTVRSFDKKK
jgi:hypothetical protein